MGTVSEDGVKIAVKLTVQQLTLGRYGFRRGDTISDNFAGKCCQFGNRKC